MPWQRGINNAPACACTPAHTYTHNSSHCTIQQMGNCLTSPPPPIVGIPLQYLHLPLSAKHLPGNNENRWQSLTSRDGGKYRDLANKAVLCQQQHGKDGQRIFNMPEASGASMRAELLGGQAGWINKRERAEKVSGR